MPRIRARLSGAVTSSTSVAPVPGQAVEPPPDHTFDLLEIDVLRSAPPLKPGRTANVSQAGEWIPCDWVEERFGSEEKLLALTRDLAALGGENRTLVSATPSETDPLWRPSEHYLVNSLLRSAGMSCSSAAQAAECSLPGSSVDLEEEFVASGERAGDRMSVEESKRRHEWFRSLSVTQEYKGKRLTPFNDLTGVVAALYCRSMTRYQAPFAAKTAPSVYVQRGLIELSQEYAEYHAQYCTRDGRSKRAEESASTAVTPSMSSASSTSAPSSSPSLHGLPPFAVSLLPLLPSLCSLTSFTRPSLLRQCLENKRILGLGDSTLQELLLQMIDFLETPDGEDETDLRKRKVEMPAPVAPSSSSSQQAASSKTSAPPNSPSTPASSPNLKPSNPFPPLSPASTSSSLLHLHPREHYGSSSLPQYYWLEIWAGKTTCRPGKEEERAPHYASRVFSTAFFPSPYLAAYNITISLRFNVEYAACDNFRGVEAPSDLEMMKEAYRFARDACLPKDAREVAERWRRHGGSWRTPQEYVTAVNAHYPHLIQPYPEEGLAGHEKRPGWGCDPEGKVGYLSDSELTLLSRGDLTSHLSLVPGFDFILTGMGAHYVAQWGDIKKQVEDQAQYQWRPSHFELALERAIRMAHHFAPTVIVVELAFRDDYRGVTKEQMVGMRKATWDVVRRMEVENQEKRWRSLQQAKHAWMETEKRRKAIIADASAMENTGSRAVTTSASVRISPSSFLSSLPRPHHVYYLPRGGVSERIEKKDKDHCSMKGLNRGWGDDGMRTPYCYPLIMEIARFMCDN
jgi:hypothetical protein